MNKEGQELFQIQVSLLVRQYEKTLSEENTQDEIHFIHGALRALQLVAEFTAGKLLVNGHLSNRKEFLSECGFPQD